jgi:CRP-like cAMP-binding protein
MSAPNTSAPAHEAGTRPVFNRLLASLGTVGDDLTESLEAVDLTSGQLLAEAGDTMSYAYFPESAVISLITVMQDGSAIEAATVGNEGFIEVTLALSGGARQTRRTVAQVPGRALRMKSSVLAAAIGRDRQGHNLFLRYAEALLFQVTQSGACNQLHSMQERCARWLLMTHDRVGTDSFLLTQEYLAIMLAVRRASVSAVAGALQRSGLIQYRRGRITILDRAGLEAASCECYDAIRREYVRQLTPSGSPSGGSG